MPETVYKAPRVAVMVASARNVAERWRGMYFKKGWNDTAGRWTRDDAEDTYNRLVALGDNPVIGAVADIIGNKSWSHLSCAACDEYVNTAVQIGESDTLICGPCLCVGVNAINKVAVP